MSVDPATLAITVALNAATMAITASQTIEGPRLNDLTVTVADYGTPMPYIVGRRRVETPVFYAEAINETKRKRKGKSGKYKEYTYSGTFAVVVADHEIDAVLKIWLDRRLAYDASGGAATLESLDAGDYIRIYLGTETQLPDERMLATVESEEGEGSCPAYLGVAYIFFEDLPLEIFGNRFPTISVEAARTALPAYPFDRIEGGSNNERLWGGKISEDGKKYFGSITDAMSLYDIETLEVISKTVSGSHTLARTSGFTRDGEIWVISGNRDDVRFYDSFLNEIRIGVGTNWVAGDGQDSLWTIYTPDDALHWMTEPYSFSQPFYVDGIQVVPSVETGFGFTMGDYCQDNEGNIWGVGRLIGPFVNTDQCYLVKVFDYEGSLTPYETLVLTLAPSGSTTEVGVMFCKSANHFVVRWNNTLYTVDKDGTVTGSAGFSLAVYGSPKQIANTIYPTEYAYINNSGLSNLAKVSLRDLSIEKTYTLATHTAAYQINGVLWNEWQNAALTFGISLDQADDMTIRYLDRVSNDGPTLGDVASIVSVDCGIPVGDYDYSALDQPVSGYSWSQGQARQILDPLFTVYDSQVRPKGFLLEGIKRGGSVVGDPIEVGSFVRTGDRDREEPYRMEVISESDLPRRIFLTYADLNSEQQPNTAVAQRSAQSVVTVRELSYDMTTLALAPDEAQQLTERALRRPWLGSIIGENKLPPNYLWALPGDIVDLDIDDEVRLRVCLKRKTISPSRILTMRWEQDRGAVSQTRVTAGAEAVGQPEQTVFDPRDTILFAMDIPLVQDSDDQTTPFIYMAATPEKVGDWSGADVLSAYTDVEANYTNAFYSFSSTQESIGGTLLGGLADAVPTVVDNKSELRVRFYSDQPTLTSVTLEELIADESLNLAIVGADGRWELIQYQNADLQSDGEWILSGLLRGRRGTESKTGGHLSGDRVLIYGSLVGKKDMGVGKIGDLEYYKAITFGLSDTDQPSSINNFTAEAHRPLSVANVQITLDPLTNTFEADWQRRTRIGGSNINGQDVPLGETSEAYVVRVMDGSTPIRIVQTYSPAFEYTSYEQIEDFGSEQTSITIEVEQLSPTLNIASETVTASG